LAEWNSTLSLLRDLARRLDPSGKRPKWLPRDGIPPSVHLDQLLHAFYYEEARPRAEGARSMEKVEAFNEGHKPDPEPFLIAAERLGVAPEDCLVFEDTEMGIQAATAAGMASVKVLQPWEREKVVSTL